MASLSYITLIENNRMEDIRAFCYGMTLKEAHEKEICIVCKKSIIPIKSDLYPQEVDEWIIAGICPDCTTKLTQQNYQQKPKARYYR